MRISRLPTQLLAAVLLPVAFAFQISEPARNYRGVTLQVTVPKVNQLGRGIPCVITLSNSGDTAAQVLTPDKARLTFNFDFTLLNGASATDIGSLGGDGKAESRGGMTLWVKVPQTSVNLPAQAEFKRNLDLRQVFEGQYPRPGKYHLRLQYDERLQAETQFEVTFVPERDVPRLIELFEQGVPGTGVRTMAAAFLNTLTGKLGHDRLELSPAYEDTPEKVKSDADQIRLWWARNRSAIHLEKGRFIKRDEAAK
jgi:hypothetical protein